MLKLALESFMTNKLFIINSKYITILTDYSGENNFTVEESGNNSFTLVIKINIFRSGSNKHYESLDLIH